MIKPRSQAMWQFAATSTTQCNQFVYLFFIMKYKKKYDDWFVIYKFFDCKEL